MTTTPLAETHNPWLHAPATADAPPSSERLMRALEAAPQQALGARR